MFTHVKYFLGDDGELGVDAHASLYGERLLVGRGVEEGELYPAGQVVLGGEHHLCAWGWTVGVQRTMLTGG